ncbi:MAG: hypothetical protein GYB64_02575 [Chloroflexi bacterium]|nr:hypothetical protein [Chloroflexota bacterium]
MTVAADDVRATIDDMKGKGWALASSKELEGGQVELNFERVKTPKPPPEKQPKPAQIQPAQPVAPQVAIPYTPPDPNIAWLELLGFLGFLGIGYLVSGRTQDGILRLVIYVVLLAGAWIVTFILSTVIIGLCLIPPLLAAQLAVPIISALTLKKELEAERAAFYQRQV